MKASRFFLVCLALCGTLAIAQNAHIDADREQLGFEDSEGVDPRKMTEAEAQKEVEKHFSLIDTDGDGSIDFTELYDRFSGHMGLRYQKLAKDHEEVTTLLSLTFYVPH
jgi:Ca2+-binding EF-hand superfamily protein